MRVKQALAGFVSMAIGCAGSPTSPRVAPDLSSPKTAAISFFNAIAHGDGPTAEAASVGSEQDKQWIRGMVSLIQGLQSYQQALDARFGRQAASTDADLRQAILTIAQDPVSKLEGGIVHEADTTAEVDPGLKGMRLTSQPPIYLRKIGGSWKVDLPAMAQDPRHDPGVTAQYLAAGRAMKQVARDISAGKYKTFDEAQHALATEVH